jgi:uncharacterized protein (DUF983 family)
MPWNSPDSIWMYLVLHGPHLVLNSPMTMLKMLKKQIVATVQPGA